jgi:hypothetical protein
MDHGWQPELLPWTEKHRIAKRLAHSPFWEPRFFPSIIDFETEEFSCKMGGF